MKKAVFVVLQMVVLSADLLKNCSRYKTEISHEFRSDVDMDILGMSLTYLSLHWNAIGSENGVDLFLKKFSTLF